MGLFKKKQRDERKKEIPSLPELPKLPEFPKTEGEKFKQTKPIQQLPSFPTNSLGKKFSQNTIKEAVAGKKEGGEVFEADDFAMEDNKMQMMQKPLRKPLTKEIPYSRERKKDLSKKTPERFGIPKRVRNAEPVFIRIDKFEDSLQIFEKTKKQILEIENMLKNIQSIKEEEEKELEYWENEINVMKEQIQKVDEDIFSKIK